MTPQYFEGPDTPGHQDGGIYIKTSTRKTTELFLDRRLESPSEETRVEATRQVVPASSSSNSEESFLPPNPSTVRGVSTAEVGP